MYPPWNYLTLRHAQNTSWAQSQFDRGVSYAKAAAALHQSCENSMALINKAEVCYKEGLEMVPHHIQILTAYGALCINDGRLEMARDLLDKAIQYADADADANFVLNKVSSTNRNRTLEDAKTYLSVVEGKLRGREQMEQASKKKGQHMALSSKAEQAMNDALAERAFFVGDDPKKASVSVSVSVSGAKSHGKYELLSSSEDNDNEQEEDNESLHKRKKKDSHRKKKRRRRESKHKHRRRRDRRKKRQRYDSSSSDHESGGDISDSRGSDASYSSDSRDRKRKRHRRKVSKSKRRSNTSR